MVKDYSYSNKANSSLPFHVLLFAISSKGSFICTIPQAVKYILWSLLHQLWISMVISAWFLDLKKHLTELFSDSYVVIVLQKPHPLRDVGVIPQSCNSYN